MRSMSTSTPAAAAVARSVSVAQGDHERLIVGVPRLDNAAGTNR
jgi:hypothetical protein